MATSRRGYTLIELMIVVAAVAVLGGLAIGSGFSWDTEKQVRVTQDGISAVLFEARAMAMAGGTPVVVSVVNRQDDLQHIVMQSEPVELEDDNPFPNNSADIEQQYVDQTSGHVMYELPEIVRITQAAESVYSDHPSENFASDPGMSTAEIEIVRLLPDGRAVLSRESWELSVGEIVYRPALASWTCRLSFEVVNDDPFSDNEPALVDPL